MRVDGLANWRWVPYLLTSLWQLRFLIGRVIRLTEPSRIHIKPDNELDHLLDEIDDTPILLEKDRELYRLAKEGVSWLQI